MTVLDPEILQPNAHDGEMSDRLGEGVVDEPPFAAIGRTAFEVLAEPIVGPVSNGKELNKPTQCAQPTYHAPNVTVPDQVTDD